jgi:hypothetical protein
MGVYSYRTKESNVVTVHFPPHITRNASTGETVTRERFYHASILGAAFFTPCLCEIVAFSLRMWGEVPCKIEHDATPDSEVIRILGHERPILPVKIVGDHVIRTSVPNLEGL